MKIDIQKIPPEGMRIEESIPSSTLDLEVEVCRLSGPLHLVADVYKITNAVTVDLKISARVSARCCRCLKDFEEDLKKKLQLHYPVNKTDIALDLNQDIREEIMLGYPLKPLCRVECKGICPRCGKDLNEGVCACKV